MQGQFAVRLEANTYSIRWHGVVSRETKDAGTVKVEDGGNITFATPFAEAGPAVLHLKRDGNSGATATTFGGRTPPGGAPSWAWSNAPRRRRDGATARRATTATG